MNLQKPLWLLFVLGLAVLAFLVIFQPIRLIPKEAAETELVTVLQYTFAKKIATTDPEREKVTKEITEALKAKGVELDPKSNVQLVTDTQVKVPVVPLSEQEKQDYERAVRELLSKYGQPIPVEQRRPGGPEEKYVARLSRLGIYVPQPMIRLGLDLIGGSQLVLRCLPQATFYYGNEEPFYPDAAARDQLREALKELLTRRGYERVDILFPEDNAVSVTVGAKGGREADAAREDIPKLLAQRFPKIKESGNPDTVLLDKGTLSRVVTIVESRVNSLGVAEATVQQEGLDKVLVQLPGVQDPARAINLIGRLANLEFRYIPSNRFKVSTDVSGETHFQDVRTGQEVPWPEVLEKSKLILTGRDLRPNSTVTDDPDTQQTTAVTFEFNPTAAQIFRRFTRTHIGQFLAIVLDGELKSCPVIRSVIPGRGIISGQRSTEEASDLMRVLNAGALPVPIEVVETNVVSATLGRDSVARSLRAGALGAIVVVVFMFLIYGICGLLADVALILYAGIVLGLFVLLGATLTLPGIAGFILSVGMAVDANVLIFERLKEELRTDKTIRAAAEAGFARAWAAILDSNVTTVLGAIVLFGLGTGGVRGFALTLTIGVLCSMFTAITVSRIFINNLSRFRSAVENRFFVHGLSGLFTRGAKA
jgi:protein-export membrane protein SecD